jgi:translation initiation factor IF-2
VLKSVRITAESGYGGVPVRLESERELELDALRTRVASLAASLAETITEGFDGFHIGAGDYVVELTVPEGPSTGGGAQARQNICLVPRRKGYSVVVAGTLDPVQSTAEVRTFEHVAILHELRFSRPLEIDEDEYASFLRTLDMVFAVARVKSTPVAPPAALIAQRRSRGRTSLAAVVLLVTLFVVAAFVALRVLRAGSH